jgi:molybdenum cofactor cytidylyltransferase
MLGAIVLAAGRSQRMGTQKLLLPLAGQTIIERVVDELLTAPITELIVVVSPDSKAIAQALSGRPVTVVINPEPNAEMLSSVRCGLRALSPQCKAVLIAVGDQPAIDSRLLMQLIEAHRNSGCGIVMPVCGGKRGHPTILSSQYFPEILNSFDGVGLRGLPLAHPHEVEEIEIDNPSILDDVDTPADYQRLLAASQGYPGIPKS